MSPYRKMAVPGIGTIVLTGALLFSQLVWQPPARAESSPPSFIGEEIQRAHNDFTMGGARRLSANWNACVDRARASQDANAAERCVAYGYGALLLGPSAAYGTGMHYLNSDVVAPGQNEMLEIMGIPEGLKQSWLERYRRWVSEGNKPDRSFAAGSGFTSDGAETPDRGFPADGGIAPDRSVAPVRGVGPPRGYPPDRGFTPVSSVAPVRDFTPSFGPSGSGPSSSEDDGNHDAQGGLAKAADGKSPRDVLRQPDIAEALRQVVGPALFGRLKEYSFGGPMEFNGRFAVGRACMPRDCGGSEARFVFSAEDAWVGIVEGRRLRIYGSPPRHVRALLLRDKNQVVWRGPVEDATQPGAAPVVPVSLEVAPRGQPDALPRVQTDSDATEIRLRRRGGTFDVPVTINGTITLPFAIDSGSSDVSVSADVMRKLVESGSVSQADFLGKQTYHLADGSRVANETFRIHSLRVGDREVRDVIGSVTNDADSLLLGQSFLTRFRSWSIDNQRGVLSLK
jgi:gag-polyprotein putative aspartyl protease